MSLDNLLGTAGVGLILLAYFTNTFGWIPKEGRWYFLMNIVGAGLACLASLLIFFWPFVVLEAVWTLVSVVGLVRVLRSGEKTSPEKIQM